MNILPNSHFTDVLNQKQLKWLAERLPEPSSHTKPAYPNIVLPPGILKLLRGGCRRRGRPPKYDSDLGKQRFVVERTNGWLKSFRRLRFRYDYTSASFRGFVLLAFLVVCVRRLVV